MDKKIIITEIRDGYVEPVIKDEDYISGGEKSIGNKLGIADPPIKEDGQWDNFIPSEEVQIKNYDTFGCTVWGTNNQIEILEKKVFGGDPNYSDRALYIMANVNPPGIDPHVIYEVVRKQGVLPEMDLPWNDDLKTLEQYDLPNPLPQDLINKAKGWLIKYNFRHEYLPRNFQGWIDSAIMKEALRRSPLAAAVYAWAFDGEKYVRAGQDTHWVTIYGYYNNGDWKCFDSYPPFQKRLDKDFGFKTAKRIWLSQNLNLQQISIFQKILEALAKILSLQWLLAEEKKKEEPKPLKPILVEPTPKPKVSKLNDFCKAIKSYEGYFPDSRSYRNKNPGNLKMTSLTASLGAIDKDQSNFCIFPDYATGWSALQSFVRLATENQLKDYHDATIFSFFKSYSDNSVRYANYVANQIDELPETLLRDFI